MLPLIPIAYDYKCNGGYFVIDKNDSLNSEFALDLIKINCSKKGNIIVKKDDSLEKEEYLLSVKENEIVIQASEDIGAYYAFQTLRQLSKKELGGKKIPCCEIHDKPRFEWRGINVDESRHFFGKDFIKRLLDMMFMMKLNVLHWHLTDDNGWRIQIDKYPLLTQKGSKRSFTQIGGWSSFKVENKEYSGYYTKDDIREIVEYASLRGIMVVPEIDFPAHCASAIACYPKLACRELERDVPGYFGGIIPQFKWFEFDWNRTLCLGKSSTFDFVFNVIDEVCELFPAPYFHIGGDEAPKNEWKKCPACQKTMKENNLADENELQGWFTNKLLDYLKGKGKRIIGWNEILKGDNIDKSAIVQYWTLKPDLNAVEYVNSGGNMIMSNHQAFYFDMTYSQYPLTNTYNFTPQKYGVTSDNIKNVLGVEGEMWSEWIRDKDKFDLSLYPRLQALSEVAWSPPLKINWADFKNRLDDFKPFFAKLGYTYAVDKVSLPQNKLTSASVKFKFRHGDPQAEVKMNKKYIEQGEK